jgi:hypothetical protein
LSDYEKLEEVTVKDIKKILATKKFESEEAKLAFEKELKKDWVTKLKGL